MTSDDWKKKPWHELTDEQLAEVRTIWETNVEKASGWSSAYYAAKCLKGIIAEAAYRGFDWKNKYPIIVGHHA